MSWGACPTACGTENLRYTSIEPRPYAPELPKFAEQCSAEDLPTNAFIIDDVNQNGPLGPNGCGSWGRVRGGTFGLTFGDDGAGHFPSKVDFHQIGGGFGGHFWFSKTHRSGTDAKFKVTGTWTPTTRLDQWAQVLVHLPPTHAHTQQAHYTVHGTKDGDRQRYIPTAQRANGWVQLGTYRFDASKSQSVELSNMTEDGMWTDDIAFDAVAFVPLSAKPKNMVVAMGDSYSSGEGAGMYYNASNRMYGTDQWNACHRSRDAWSRKMVLPGYIGTVGANADVYNPTVDFQFLACSGATGSDMTTPTPAYWHTPTPFYERRVDAEGRFNEAAQVDAGALSVDTTLVTLSIGGNDAGFPQVTTYCGMNDCATSAYEQQVAQGIAAARYTIMSTVRAVQSRAPNAYIMLVGYPELFGPEHGYCTLLAGISFNENEIAMLNRLAEVMRDQQAGIVTEVNNTNGNLRDVSFLDVIGAFSGHGACNDTGPGSPERWINEIIVASPPSEDGDFQDIEGDGLDCAAGFCVSRGSLHPNGAGTSGYATAVGAELRRIGYP